MLHRTAKLQMIESYSEHLRTAAIWTHMGMLPAALVLWCKGDVHALHFRDRGRGPSKQHAQSSIYPARAVDTINCACWVDAVMTSGIHCRLQIALELTCISLLLARRCSLRPELT